MINNASKIEKMTAEALLDVGVSVPISKLYHLPILGRDWQLRLTMRRPYLGGLVRLSRLYLDMQVTADQVDEMGQQEQLQLLADHGKTISMIIALTICRGYLSGKILAPLVAWILRHYVEPIYLTACFTRFISLLDMGDFGVIIRYLEGLNPMSPILSQGNKGS